MNIRTMGEGDFFQVNELMRQVHELHLTNRPDFYVEMDCVYSEEEFRKMIQSEDMITILAEEKDKVLGICIISIRKRSGMLKKRYAYMEDLCVDQDWRGQGIGKILFADAERRAKVKGAERLDLMVWSFNDSAMAFYKSLGMKPQRYLYEKELG